MEDRLLVGALRSGSPDAIGAVYDTYADRLYDYCWFQLRDRDAARVALRDTLMCAEAHAGVLRVPGRFGPWLYAIARIECRRRCGPPSDRPDLAVARHDQDDADLRLLAWQAIVGLPPLSRELLALRHRHALPVADIAAVTGLPAREIRDLLDQADVLLQAALFAEILAYDGAFECARRAFLLRHRDGALDDDLRERLVRHAIDCDACARHLPRHVSAAKVCELLPRAVPSAALRAHVIECFTDPALGGYRLFAASRLRAFTAHGFPEQPGTGRSAIPRPAARRWPRALIAVAGALFAAVAAAYVSHWLGHEPDRVRVVRADSAPPWRRVPSPGPALPPGTPGPPGVGHPVSATFPFGPSASPRPTVPGTAPGGLPPLMLISAPGPGRIEAWPGRLAICAGGTGTVTVRASGGPVMWQAAVAGVPHVEPAGGILDAGETGRLTVRAPAGGAGRGVVTFWPGGARVTVTWCARPGPPESGGPQPPPSSSPSSPAQPSPSQPPPSSPPQAPSPSPPHASHPPSPEPSGPSAPPPSAPPPSAAAPAPSAPAPSTSAASARPSASAASSPPGEGPSAPAVEAASAAGRP